MDQSVGQQKVQPSPSVQQPAQTPTTPLASPQPQKPSKSYFKRLVSERLNRRSYIIGTILTGILMYPLAFSLVIAPPQVILVFLAFFAFLAQLFSVVLLARRLHDLNISGWFALLYQLLTYILIFYPIYTRNYALFDLNNLSFLIEIVLFILPGTSGDNKYGAKPLPRMNIIKDILQIS